MNSIRNIILHNLFKRQPEGLGERCNDPLASPRQDWLFICTIFAFGCVLLAVLGIGLYVWVVTGDSGSARGAVMPPVGPSQEELSKIISAYNTRDAQYQQLLASTPAVSDPEK